MVDDSGLPPARRLYERVETERKQRGWSLAELERRSGVARSTTHRWKTGKTVPQPETVIPVADALGIPRLDALRLAGLLVDSPAERALEDAVTQPLVNVDVEGDGTTAELLARLSASRRAMLERFRQSERQRLARMAEDAARETYEANRRFAELVRIEADESGITEA